MSTTKLNNPPAFPVPMTEQDCGEPGMSLRDYFAGQALAGAMASLKSDETWPAPGMAAHCYRVADAMLREREAKQ